MIPSQHKQRYFPVLLHGTDWVLRIMWQIFSPCQYHSTNTTHSSSPSPGDLHTQHCSCRISGEHRTDKYFQFLWSLSAKHTENCTATSAGTNPVSGPLLPTFQYFSRSWLFYGAESFKLVKKSLAVFTRARHLSLPWARQTHSTLWHLCLSRTLKHYLPSYAYSFPTKTMHVLLPHSCHIPPPSAHSTNHEAPRHANLSSPCHLLPLQLKHPALQPIFEGLQPTLFPWVQKTSFARRHIHTHIRREGL